MVGARANHADLDPVALIPASEAIDDVYPVAGIEVVDGALAVDSPDLGKSAGGFLVLNVRVCKLNV
jgi:hypothetical protein